MSNPNQAFGLRAIGTLSGAPVSGKLRKMHVASNYGTAVFPGDPVIITGTSFADGQGSGDYLPEVNVATAAGTNYISGVVDSVVPTTEADPLYIPASTGGYVLVNDDSSSLFEIQASTTYATGNQGNTCSLVAGAGSTVLGTSGWQADTTTIGTGTQLVLQGVRQSDRNDLTSANPVLIVTINLHQSRNTTGV